MRRKPARPDGDAGGGVRSDGRESIALVLAGRTLVRGRLEPVEIGIDEDGRIRRVAKSVTGDRRRELGDRVILPAATDVHVHFREPGGPREDESLATGTLQAAFGGVGTVGEMPNTVPAVDSVETLEQKIGLARGQLAVDVAFYAGVSRPAAIPRLAGLAAGFKLYLSPTTAVEAPPPLPEVREVETAVAQSGLPLFVHAEDPRVFRPVQNLRSTAEWDAHRPGAAEARAVGELLPAPEALRLHVAHVTQAPVARLLGEAGASFEATPHHLLLSTRSVTGPRGKVNPPLRSEAERASLYAAFCEGKVPLLASDHAPHSVEAKERAFPLAPSGMPGVETMLPLLLARVRAGDLPLATLVAAACDRPARWLGLPVGRVALGHRANLLVVDFRARVRIAADRLHAPCHWTAFEGWEGIFPTDHFRDGRPIVHDGEFVGRRDGAAVRPEFAPAPVRSNRLTPPR